MGPPVTGFSHSVWRPRSLHAVAGVSVPPCAECDSSVRLGHVCVFVHLRRAQGCVPLAHGHPAVNGLTLAPVGTQVFVSAECTWRRGTAARPLWTSPGTRTGPGLSPNGADVADGASPTAKREPPLEGPGCLLSRITRLFSLAQKTEKRTLRCFPLDTLSVLFSQETVHPANEQILSLGSRPCLPHPQPQSPRLESGAEAPPLHPACPANASPVPRG